MTTDYRALCAELLILAEESISYRAQVSEAVKMIDRARAALAEPEPSADGDVAELPPRPPLMKPPAHPALERYGVTWDGSPDKPLLTRRADGYWTPWHVAADLLERLAPQPVPEGPADDDIEALHQAVFASRLQGPPPNTSFEVDLVRAALARWGHAPNA